jgi:LysM repeat protein
MENIKCWFYLVSFVVLFSLMTTPLIIKESKTDLNSINLTYKVKKGDNLWVIGSKLNQKNISKFVFEVKKINNLEESVIYVDQVIKIP